MPTIFGHAVVGAALATACRPRAASLRRMQSVAALCAVLPDLDVVAFTLRIPYSNMLGHRGLSHSLLAAVLIGAAGTLVACWPEGRFSGGVFLLLAAAAASHGVLDAMTNGGLGVAFFAPFSAVRYWLPWRPIIVSPIGIDAFEGRAAIILLNEVLWVCGRPQLR